MNSARCGRETDTSEAERPLKESTRRVVRAMRLGHPRTHRIAAVVLALLATVCVAATLTRLSPLPLIPLPALAVAAYAHYRARRAADDEKLARWSAVMVTGTVLGFWLISVVGRALES